jgi:hypothetical protein
MPRVGAYRENSDLLAIWDLTANRYDTG